MTSWYTFAWNLSTPGTFESSKPKDLCSATTRQKRAQMSNFCITGCYLPGDCRHARVSVPVERLRLAGKEGTEWVRGSGCTATSESGLSNQSQLKCYSFVDKIYIQYRNWFILQKLMHPELRLTFFTLSSGVVSQNVKCEEIFEKKNHNLIL